MKDFFKKIYNKTVVNNVIKQNKTLLLLYLANGLRKGNNLLTLIEQYQTTLDLKEVNEKIINNLLNNIINIIKSGGHSTPGVLRKVGLLTEKEFLIVSNYNELYLGLDLILKLNKQKNNFYQAILLFFFPTLLVLIGLFIFQPEIKSFAYNAIEPINTYSKKMIKIPAYLETRFMFAYLLTGWISLYLIIMYSIVYIKKKHSTKFFKFFKLAEKEFVINTFSSILNLRKSGKSYGESYKILYSTTNDLLIKKFYKEVYNETQKGNKTAIYDISKKYNMNKFNLSYFKTGLLTNDLTNSIETILEYNNTLYDKQIKLLVKYLPLVGEIIMTIVLVKPLIDIIMVTTVDVMNFTL